MVERGTVWGQTISGPQQRFAPAQEEFGAELQRAWPSPEAQRAVSDAFAAYAAIVQEPWRADEFSRRAADAYADGTKQLQIAFAEGGADLVVDAFRRYTQQLKLAWAELDPETLTPEDVGVIAQAMSWVAWVALEVAAAAPAPSPVVEPPREFAG